MWYQVGTVRSMAMTLRLTEEENQRLAELAEAEGRSKQEVIRLALADRWTRMQQEEKLGEVLGRILPKYRGLLDRLGPA